MSMGGRLAVAAAALAIVAGAGSAQAAGELKQIGSIAIPSGPTKGFDITWVDQKTQRVFLADRDHGTVDIFDGNNDTYIGSVSGFVGPHMVNGKVDPDTSGPAGVVVYGDSAWLGDGDSTAKEVDLKTMKIVASISTGGTHRFDEIAYDPKDHVLAGGNGDDDPPFATLISTTTKKVIAKIPFEHATDGLEQPAWNPVDGNFYFSVPELDKDVQKNAVAVISPQGKLVKMMPVTGCHPNGIVFGPGENLMLGCSARGDSGMPPVMVVINWKTGKVVATIAGAGGADEIAYSKKNHQYYTGSAGMKAVFVIDAITNKLVQKIHFPEGKGRTHSVAASDVTGKVFIPESTDHDGCGCMGVWAPAK
jgi:DNA-binding beta-propeller fold protein YncE